MADNDKIWADGEDPFADFRKTMERRYWVALKHGKDTPEFFEAVRQQGLSIEGDEKKIRKLAEADDRAPKSVPIPLVTHLGPDGKRGMELTISVDSRAHKEQGINAAIVSLGDRAGDEVEDISRDLKKVLRDRDLGLDQDILDKISSLLADGTEVRVGVHS